MIGSLFDKLKGERKNVASNSSPPDLIAERPHRKISDTAGDELLLAVLPTVQKIVRRRLFLHTSDALDLVQAVAVKLLRWREKYVEKSEKMSPVEWQSFAARAAYNEVNDHFSKEAENSELPLEEAAVTAGNNFASVEGETATEVQSLARLAWQGICNLSLRQRQALLLHSRELLVYFLQCGVGNRELAGVLNFAESRWDEIKSRMPLRDSQIANLSEAAVRSGRGDVKPTANSIKKARHEARARLQKIMGQHK